MAITSGFWNSLAGDRKYNSEELSTFAAFITSGLTCVIYGYGNMFRATNGNGRQVIIKSGKAFVADHYQFYNQATSLFYVINDSDYELTIEPNNSSAESRIDAIRLVVRKDTSIRSASFEVVKGTPYINNNANDHWTSKPSDYPLAYGVIAWVICGPNNQQPVLINAVGRRDRSGQNGFCYPFGGPINVWFMEDHSQWSSFQNSFNSNLTTCENQFRTWFNQMKNALNQNVIDSLQSQITTNKNALATLRSTVDNLGNTYVGYEEKANDRSNGTWYVDDTGYLTPLRMTHNNTSYEKFAEILNIGPYQNVDRSIEFTARNEKYRLLELVIDDIAYSNNGTVIRNLVQTDRSLNNINTRCPKLASIIKTVKPNWCYFYLDPYFFVCTGSNIECIVHVSLINHKYSLRSSGYAPKTEWSSAMSLRDIDVAAYITRSSSDSGCNLYLRDYVSSQSNVDIQRQLCPGYYTDAPEYNLQQAFLTYNSANYKWFQGQYSYCVVATMAGSLPTIGTQGTDAVLASPPGFTPELIMHTAADGSNRIITRFTTRGHTTTEVNSTNSSFNYEDWQDRAGNMAVAFFREPRNGSFMVGWDDFTLGGTKWTSHLCGRRFNTTTNAYEEFTETGTTWQRTVGYNENASVFFTNDSNTDFIVWWIDSTRFRGYHVYTDTYEQYDGANYYDNFPIDPGTHRIKPVYDDGTYIWMISPDCPIPFRMSKAAPLSDHNAFDFLTKYQYGSNAVPWEDKVIYLGNAYNYAYFASIKYAESGTDLTGQPYVVPGHVTIIRMQLTAPYTISHYLANWNPTLNENNAVGNTGGNLPLSYFPVNNIKKYDIPLTSTSIGNHYIAKANGILAYDIDANLVLWFQYGCTVAGALNLHFRYGTKATAIGQEGALLCQEAKADSSYNKSTGTWDYEDLVIPRFIDRPDGTATENWHYSIMNWDTYHTITTNQFIGTKV